MILRQVRNYYLIHVNVVYTDFYWVTAGFIICTAKVAYIYNHNAPDVRCACPLQGI